MPQPLAGYAVIFFFPSSIPDIYAGRSASIRVFHEFLDHGRLGRSMTSGGSLFCDDIFGEAVNAGFIHGSNTSQMGKKY